MAQELSSILDQIPALQRQREQAKSIQGKAKKRKQHEGKPADDHNSAEEEVVDDVHISSIQTFVFSATLTLPQSLRKRLKKGETLSLHWVRTRRQSSQDVIFVCNMESLEQSNWHTGSKIAVCSS